MLKKNIIIILIIFLILIVGGFVFYQQPQALSKDSFTEIEECILGVHVDYDSRIRVQNEKDVRTVFNNFIIYSKSRDKDIFGYDSKNWRYENSTIHGLYQGKKYWKVTASWFSEEDQKWRINTVFDVSENGEVVRLLGCI